MTDPIARSIAMSAAGWLCVGCGLARPLQAHHRTYLRHGMERPGDLAPLCSDCHQLAHGIPPRDPDEEWLRGVAARRLGLSAPPRGYADVPLARTRVAAPTIPGASCA